MSDGHLADIPGFMSEKPVAKNDLTFADDGVRKPDPEKVAAILAAAYDPKAFQPIALDRTGLRFDLSEDEYPTQVFTLVNDTLPLGNGHTHFVMVTDGWVLLNYRGKGWALTAGMFAVVPGLASLDTENGKALIISRLDYTGLFQVGGPLEARGRLKYIDGCSDTLLVGPPVVGEPCLNHLHMPVGTNQTQHTHPSSRIGVIMGARGGARRRTPRSRWPAAWAGSFPPDASTHSSPRIRCSTWWRGTRIPIPGRPTRITRWRTARTSTARAWRG